MKILILGGGIAAFEAAAAAAAQDGMQVTICSGESVLPYRRPALSRMVAEDITDTAFYLKPAGFYAERGIEVKLNKQAVRIDKNSKQVFFKDSELISYDRLIIATGGYAFIPPVEGSENAMVLRDYENLQQIRKKLEAGVKNAVIIGAGVLGLELADSLLLKECKVTVLESAPEILQRYLDQESAAIIRKQLGSLPGFNLKTGVSVKKITRNAVELADDQILDSDLTLFSAGVRSCSAIAADADIKVGCGIIVDEYMRSTDPAIYACGDAAEPPCGGCGLLPAAKSMGHIAGVNAAGGNEAFLPELYPVRLMALGIKLFSAGKLDDARSEISRDGENFQRLTYDDSGKLTGAILLGDLKSAVKLQKEIAG